MNVGLIFASVGFFILIFSIQSPIPILGMVVFRIGHGMVFPTSAGIIRLNSEEKNRGLTTGTFYALVVAGIALGAPIYGLIYELYGPQIMFIMGMMVPIDKCNNPILSF